MNPNLLELAKETKSEYLQLNDSSLAARLKQYAKFGYSYFADKQDEMLDEEGGDDEFWENYNAFTSQPFCKDFLAKANTIKELVMRWAYIVRKAYEIGEAFGLPVGAVAQRYHLHFRKQLQKDYDIPLICPHFFNETYEPFDGDCMSGGKNPICKHKGDYFECVRFRMLEKNSVVSAPKEIDFIDVEPVDLDDLSDWHCGWGEYE
jgi:hypothetical protein